MQGGNLKLKADSLDNAGTLLATSQMSLKARQMDNQKSGKLFSGGDISLASSLLNQYGQLVALGNMTLTLKDAFTQSGTLAAGKALVLTSDGDILLQGTTQGQSLDLRSGGQLTNAGTLRGGSGEMRLEAAGITQNAAASLQSGGLVQLLSRGDINNNGFIGTAGYSAVECRQLIAQQRHAVRRRRYEVAGGSYHQPAWRYSGGQQTCGCRKTPTAMPTARSSTPPAPSRPKPAIFRSKPRICLISVMAGRLTGKTDRIKDPLWNGQRWSV